MNITDEKKEILQVAYSLDLLDLPYDVLDIIFRHLDFSDVLNLKLLSKKHLKKLIIQCDKAIYFKKFLSLSDKFVCTNFMFDLKYTEDVKDSMLLLDNSYFDNITTITLTNLEFTLARNKLYDIERNIEYREYYFEELKSLLNKFKNVYCLNIMANVEHCVTFGELTEGVKFGVDETFGRIIISNTIMIKEMHSKCIGNENIAAKIYRLVTKEYNGKLFNAIPQSVEELILDDRFESHVLKNLPPVKKLIVGDAYNKTIRHLPTTITYLDLGDGFNCPIEHLANLKNLVYLRIGNAFKKDIVVYDDGDLIPTKSCFPQSLKVLKLGSSFNRILWSWAIPHKLTEFHVGHEFDQSINNLPDSVEIIKIGDGYTQPIRHLPKKLKHLEIGNAFNNTIEIIEQCSIETIIIGHKFDRKFLPQYPHTAKYIKIGFDALLNVK